MLLMLPFLASQAQDHLGILPIPPAPAIFDEFVIDVGTIGQEHIGKGAPVLVLPVGLEHDFFAKD